MLKSLCRFIKLVPEDILYKCINEVNVGNRSTRRKFNRIKGEEKKLDVLLNIKDYRIQLIKLLYAAYCSDKTEYESKDYDELIESINSENYISKIIYILY